MRVVTFLLVNWKTPDLMRQAIESMRNFYFYVPWLIVDNGGCEESREYLEALERNPLFEVIYNDENRNHGPAMDQGMQNAGTRYVFTLDSDTVTRRRGFLEDMLAIATRGYYAVGNVYRINEFGGRGAGEKLVNYVAPCAALWDRGVYLNLKPFEHHGAPCLANLWAAQRRGYPVYDYPVDHYVEHLKQGTRGQHGSAWYDRSVPAI